MIEEQHNHLKKVMKLYEAGLIDPRPGCQELRVIHDDDCGFLRGYRCNCDPRVEILPRRIPAEQRKQPS